MIVESKNLTNEKIAVTVDQSSAVITAKSAHGVTRISLRCVGHLARALDWVPKRKEKSFCFFPFCLSDHPLVAVGCSGLPCAAVCCSVVPSFAVDCSTLQCAEWVAVGCIVLQYAAVCCRVVPCVAVCCGVLQCITCKKERR